MTETKPTTATKGQKMGFATMSAAAIALLGASLLSSEERVLTTYLDVFGVPTVCKGITGKGVVIGKTYTLDECIAMEHAYLQDMGQKLGRCVGRQDFDLHQVVAWSHFGFNVGNNGFCTSTAAKLLNARRDDAACDQMMRWTWGTKDGAKVNCTDRRNGCYGLVDRRKRERAMCYGDLDAFKR